MVIKLKLELNLSDGQVLDLAIDLLQRIKVKNQNQTSNDDQEVKLLKQRKRSTEEELKVIDEELTKRYWYQNIGRTGEIRHHAQPP